MISGSGVLIRHGRTVGHPVYRVLEMSGFFPSQSLPLRRQGNDGPYREKIPDCWIIEKAHLFSEQTFLDFSLRPFLVASANPFPVNFGDQCCMLLSVVVSAGHCLFDYPPILCARKGLK